MSSEKEPGSPRCQPIYACTSRRTRPGSCNSCSRGGGGRESGGGIRDTRGKSGGGGAARNRRTDRRQRRRRRLAWPPPWRGKGKSWQILGLDFFLNTHTLYKYIYN